MNIGTAAFLALLLSFLLLPVRTLWRTHHKRGVPVTKRDLIWLGLYMVMGVRTLRFFGAYLITRGML